MKEFFTYLKKNIGQLIVMMVIVTIVYWTMFSYIFPREAPPQRISYNEFLQLVENGDVDSIYYSKTEEDMTVVLFNDLTRGIELEEDRIPHYTNADRRIVYYPFYDNFRQEMLLKGIQMHVLTAQATIIEVVTGIISLFIPLVIIIVFYRIMMMQSRGLDKKSLIQTSNVRFTDIIGHEEILDDVKFITELIKDPTKGDSVGAKVPKGLLLVGEPGTGKTLLAKAMAGEAGVPFLYQNASNFIEMFVGLGAKRVRELFKYAKEVAPCIIFIDEIDSIGEARGSSKGTSENDQTINALLQEMDGFSGREGVFIIAATNRADTLDPALVRSGRFDRQITVNPPRGWKVRCELFKYYLDKFNVSADIDIVNLSKQVSGFTGADIAMVCNEAAVIAVMRGIDKIDMDCIEEAIDKKIFKGNRTKKEQYVKDKKIVAYHEAGHAVMSHLVGWPIARASIQSTISGVGGAVFNQDKEDTMFMTKTDFTNRILIAYAGRASEEIKFGKDNITTGASNDISQATGLMMQYIESMGFDDKFGLLDVSVLSKSHLVDAEDLTDRLSTMSCEIYDECVKKLKASYDKVERLATRLMEVDTLSGAEIQEIMDADSK